MGNQPFWQLEHCPDDEVLAGVERSVRSARRNTAELIAHLGEVEARRLHLEAACGSMFDYCVKRLGLSEDEACRRIDVARLARRFPALFPRLASGEVSLTVAALLKPYLDDQNQADLIAGVTGKTIQQVREVLAARFPKPDVATSVRKLPERPVVASAPPRAASQSAFPELQGSQPALMLDQPQNDVSPPASARSTVPTLARKAPAVVEPLSEARYRVQFTVSAAVKDKLERARDLMRHRNPSGDLAAIVERALDGLLEQLMKERFGVTNRPRTRDVAAGSQRVNNATRRALLDRDGLHCSWVDDDGRRCESRAWLEIDHRQPRGKGGGSELSNVRVLCAAHNRLAAEQEYGRDFVEAMIAQRRMTR